MTENRVNTTLRIPDKLLKRLKRFIKKRPRGPDGRKGSQNEWICRLVAEAMDTREEKK